MEVVRSEILGFCMGVRRAVETAWRASGRPGCRVYTAGPLIHNPEVLGMLKKRGVEILDEGEFPPEFPPESGPLRAAGPSPEKIENAAVIIRAHGIPPAKEAGLKRLGFRVIDATCPKVKASQIKARFFAEKGYAVFLAGEKGHGEIAGLRGCVEAAPQFAPSPDGGVSACYVVGNPEEAQKAGEDLFRRNRAAKTVLIGQTTISPGEYRAIGDRLARFFPGLETLDTICGATAARQEALRALCAKVDAAVIVGGKESANTRRLLVLARELEKPAWLIEKPGEIPEEIRAYRSVGLSAGASTPDSLIAEIEDALRAI